MKNTRLSTAMHEAGHAIAQLADATAPWIESINLDGLEDGLLGRVNTSASWQPYMASIAAQPEVIETWRASAWRDVIVYLAGPIAELRWRRCSRAGISLSTGEMATHCLGELAPAPHSDLGRVQARLRWAFPGSEAASFGRGWLEAEVVVARHWRTIVVLGRELARSGRMEGDRARELYRQLSPGGA